MTILTDKLAEANKLKGDHKEKLAEKEKELLQLNQTLEGLHLGYHKELDNRLQQQRLQFEREIKKRDADHVRAVENLRAEYSRSGGGKMDIHSAEAFVKDQLGHDWLVAR